MNDIPPKAILLLLTGLIVVWNVFFAGPENAVSDVVIRASTKYPLVPFLFGLLAGHLFWRN